MVDGAVIGQNEKIETEPGMVNEDAEGEGWIMNVKVDDATQVMSLLTEEQYKEHIK